jgi:hypothetical protein
VFVFTTVNQVNYKLYGIVEYEEDRWVKKADWRRKKITMSEEFYD